MSDIKVGDLVMVVKPPICCGDTSNISRIFVVSEIDYDDEWCCNYCNKESSELCYKRPDEDDWYSGYEIKKIEPLSDTDTIETIKELEHE